MHSLASTSVGRPALLAGHVKWRLHFALLILHGQVRAHLQRRDWQQPVCSWLCQGRTHVRRCWFWHRALCVRRSHQTEGPWDEGGRQEPPWTCFAHIHNQISSHWYQCDIEWRMGPNNSDIRCANGQNSGFDLRTKHQWWFSRYIGWSHCDWKQQKQRDSAVVQLFEAAVAVLARLGVVLAQRPWGRLRLCHAILSAQPAHHNRGRRRQKRGQALRKQPWRLCFLPHSRRCRRNGKSLSINGNV